MNFRTTPLAAAVAGLFLGIAVCAVPTQAATMPAVRDMGATAPMQAQTVSIVLQLRNTDQLDTFIAGTTDPSSANYHQFLSVADFAAHYAPSDADIARVTAELGKLGIAVTEIYKSHTVIRATGTTAQLNKFFATEVHNYQENTLTYKKPNQPITIPGPVADVVLTVTGLDTKPKAHPMSKKVSNATGESIVLDSSTVKLLPGSTTTTGNAPGQYTVADVADLYNIKPLYKHHINGEGRRIGIATLATFDPADAYAYWDSLGIKYPGNKITQVHVDGGAGTAGADETTLDVEQSGGLAPAARVTVYDAPNTDQGFIDVFLKAADENKVDTLSVSWGGAEIGQSTDVLTGQHQAFMQLAAQGISVFAASGDAGAYDINNSYPYPTCTTLLSVDSPASDPLVVAAGGITLANTQVHKYGTVVVPHDRPWAWDYLQNYLVTNYGEAFYYANYFPVGGGGGVSVNYDLPKYQKHLSGVQLSAPNQSLICQSSTGPVDYIDMPAGYAGRNVPDLSLNADPYTGYGVYFGGAWIYGFGGTSFVAPQLNGIAALVSQYSGSRLGQLNPQLYSRFRQFGYSTNSPFKAITTGDNEYWQAQHNYNPASGIGSLNVHRLAKSFAQREDDQGDD